MAKPLPMAQQTTPPPMAPPIYEPPHPPGPGMDVIVVSRTLGEIHATRRPWEERDDVLGTPVLVMTVLEAIQLREDLCDPQTIRRPPSVAGRPQVVQLPDGPPLTGDLDGSLD